MADVLNTDQRSYNMSQIRSKDTGPELLLRQLLITQGLNSFTAHPDNIPGHPDFYFPDRKAALFVDGCFWHGCKKCYQSPKTNQDFWASKIRTNILRDKKVNLELKKQGIKTLRIKEHDLKNNQDRVVKNLSHTIGDRKHPVVLDLFAGAGGLSEGFIRSGYDVIGHIEMNNKACSTITTRMIYHALAKSGNLSEYIQYIEGKLTRDELIEKNNMQDVKESVICATIGKDNYEELIAQVKKRLNGKKLDIIVGGPPCQAYSYIGRARDTNRMRLDGRNYLYWYYVEFLKALKPKIFVFENVPGLLTAGKGKYLEDMRNLMKEADYTTDYRILNAADFGVPQNRKRIILVGWNKNSGLSSYPEFPTVKRDYVVNDFLSDLPELKAGEGTYLRKPVKNNKLLEKLGIISQKFNYILDHISRPNTNQDLEIYRIAIEAKQRGEIFKYNRLPRRLKTHNNENGFLDRFKVVDGNALGSHTVVAHIAKDGHYYIHPDINQNRSLTVREAARLQTFPDDYKFEGERGPQFKQIGNAVPPMLSEIIAKELLKYL